MARKDKKDESKTSLIVISFVIVVAIVAAIIFVLKFNKQPAGEEVAAVVNGDNIYLNELDERYEKLPEQYKALTTKETYLDQMIMEKLLLQEAKKENIAVTDEQVDKEIDNILSSGLLTMEDFEKTLEKQNLTLEQFKDLYKKQLVINELLNRSVISKISAEDKEIEDFYNKNINLFSAKQGQIRARHILVESEEEAEKNLQELKEGGDFIELAKENSKDKGSAALGGDLGFFGKGQMVKEFEEAAFSLDIGEVSKIVKTQFGYHLIKREKDSIDLEEAKSGIEQMIIRQKQDSEINGYIGGLKNSSNIQILFMKEKIQPTQQTETKQITTFKDTGREICKQDGKPTIRLFCTSSSKHCEWITKTFDKVAEEHKDSIEAYNWQLDTGDNTLTSEVEKFVPKLEVEIYRQYNPGTTVPTFVFGCKYVRIGNGYEKENNLNAEEEEFRKVIESMV